MEFSDLLLQQVINGLSLGAMYALDTARIERVAQLD